MQTIERSYSVKKVIESITNGCIVFNHPMQRKPGQWDDEQQSLIVHSILGGYAIPQTYALPIIDGDFDSFSILDGKQRLTTIYDYVNDGFSLADDTPTVTLQKRKVITDNDGNRHLENDVEEYDISGKYYSQIDERLQDKIMDHEISVIMLVNCTDEEIEDQFYRLNNGTALTKDQKTRVLLGDELAAFVDIQEQKDIFKKKSYFTTLQRKRGEVQTCILQTLMLVMDFPFKNFNNDAVMEFAEWFRKNHQMSDLDYCSDLFDKLNEAIAITDKPNKLMKKINIPILAYHVQTADEIGIDINAYGHWITGFFSTYTSDSEYASYCGQSSTSKAKVKARLDYVEKELRRLVS